MSGEGDLWGWACEFILLKTQANEIIYLQFNMHVYLDRPERDYFLCQNQSEIIFFPEKTYPPPRFELVTV